MHKNPKPIRVLLVDDEVEFLDSTARALSRRRFDVTTARDGDTALRVLDQVAFQVAVLDVKMPGIQGDDLFRLLKQRCPELPVILLTGHGNIQQAFHTSREGVFEYLTKPCDIELLADSLRRAAALSSTTGAAEKSSSSFDGTAPEGPLEEIRLLLVDDEPEFLQSLSTSLKRRGMATSVAIDGAAALALVDQQRFDVAVVDLKMPGMDGLELLARLQQAQPAMEVLLLTGHPTVGTVRKALNQGAFDYVLKPHDIHELVHKIRLAHERSKKRTAQQQTDQIHKIRERMPD